MPTVTEMLDFEARWPRSSSSKEEAIRAQMGMPPARFYQLLGRAIDTLEAERERPLIVHALRRRRDARAAERQRRTSR